MNNELSIYLARDWYYAGENVTGRVTFDIPRDRLIHGIHLHFGGFEQIENWVASIPLTKKWVADGSTTIFGGKVHLTREGLSYSGTRPTEAEGIMVSAGKHSWPFNFHLPENLPPSLFFRGGKIKIEYTVTAIVDIPWGKSVKTSTPIKICNPTSMVPSTPNVSRNSKWFLLRGPGDEYSARERVLHIEASADKPYTYAQDTCRIRVKVDNNSGKHVHAIKVKLKQLWTYSGGYTEKFTIYKHKYRDSHFPLGQVTHNANINVAIPDLNSKPSVVKASLIKVAYYVTVIAQIRAGTDLRTRVPLIIGHRPRIDGQSPSRSDNSNSASTNSASMTSNLDPFHFNNSNNQQFNMASPTRPQRPESKGATMQVQDLIDLDTPIPSNLPGVLPLPTTTGLLNSNKSTVTDPNSLDSLFEIPRPAPVQKPVSLAPPSSDSQPRQAPAQRPPVSVARDTGVKPAPRQNAPPSTSTSSSSKPSTASKPSNSSAPKSSVPAMSIGNELKELDDVIKNLEHASQFAASPSYAEQVKLNPTSTLDGAMTSLVASAREMLLASNKLKEAAITGSPDYNNMMKDCIKRVQNLSRESTAVAGQLSLSGPQYQHQLLKLAKRIAQTLQDELLATDELKNVENKTSVYSKDVVVNILNDAVQRIRDQCLDLSKIANQSFEVVSNHIVQIQNMKQQLYEAYMNFIHPQGKSNRTAALSDALIHCDEYCSTASKLGMVSGVSDLMPVLTSVHNTCEGALPDFKGVLAPVEDKFDAENCVKEMMTQTMNMYDLAVAVLKQGNVMHPNNLQQPLSQTVIASIKACNELRSMLMGLCGQKVENYTSQTKLELDKAVSAISVATQKLMACQKAVPQPNPFSDPSSSASIINSNKNHLYDASSAVTRALQNLMSTAQQVQESNVLNNGINAKGTQEDSQWISGMVSVSSTIAALVEKLAEAVDSQPVDIELVTALSRQIHASTVQLIAAERVRLSPDSPAHQVLQQAVRSVSTTTNDLVARAKELCTRYTISSQPSTFSSAPSAKSLVSDRVKELEAAVKVVRLENELEAARNEIFGARKSRNNM